LIRVCLTVAREVRAPYSKDQKNDFRDAEVIAEAVQRRGNKKLRTNSICKGRIVYASGWSASALAINQIRDFLLERARAFASCARSYRAFLHAPQDVLSPRMVQIIAGLVAQSFRVRWCLRNRGMSSPKAVLGSSIATHSLGPGGRDQ
jgi:transposase